MEELDYYLKHVHGRSSSENEVELDLTKEESPKQEQIKGIEFSKKILNVLEDKLKEHNSQYSKRVKLHQLRSVFCKGARESGDLTSSITENGLARVSLFLRISAGKIDDINLDINKKPSYNKLVDIADYFMPSEEDFGRAKSDIESYDLDYHFEDIDELYIDNDGASPHLYFDY